MISIVIGALHLDHSSKTRQLPLLSRLGQSRVTPLGSGSSLSAPLRLAWRIMELESGAECPERKGLAEDATVSVIDPDGPPRPDASNNGGRGEWRQETDESTRLEDAVRNRVRCWQLRIDETRRTHGSPTGITIYYWGCHSVGQRSGNISVGIGCVARMRPKVVAEMNLIKGKTKTNYSTSPERREKLCTLNS